MGIELKRERIDPSKHAFSEEQTIKAEEAIQRALQMQRDLGLGDSSRACANLLEGCRAAKNVKLLHKAGFEFIEEPKEADFPRFHASTVSLPEAPKYAMVKLGTGTKDITCSTPKGSFSANLPIMPITVLEMAARVKEITPDAEFHLIMEPEWKKLPQKDPVLVARVGADYWIEVGHWGSDADAIKSILGTVTA